MPTSDRDIQALTYLTRRLRDETHGCNQWDEAGTFAVLKDTLAGQNLLIACQRVIGHATDPEAKTPGAIKRPFIPKVATPAPARVVYDPRQVCHDCGKRFGIEHAQTDHWFRSVEAVRAIRSTPPPPDLRNKIAPLRTFSKPPPETPAPISESTSTTTESEH